jgi:hypothetical protein
VVAWTADTNVPGGNGYDIYLTRFDNAGNVLGTPEQRVSVSPGSADAQPGSQDLPRIAAHADGSMMIVWRDSNGNDGSGWGIFGRSFDAVSGSFGNTVQVNSYTYSTQIDPDVAALAGGGYVVVWRDDNGRDGSGYATSPNASTPAARRWAASSASTTTCRQPVHGQGQRPADGRLRGGLLQRHGRILGRHLHSRVRRRRQPGGWRPACQRRQRCHLPQPVRAGHCRPGQRQLRGRLAGRR